MGKDSCEVVLKVIVYGPTKCIWESNNMELVVVMKLLAANRVRRFSFELEGICVEGDIFKVTVIELGYI